MLPVLVVVVLLLLLLLLLAATAADDELLLLGLERWRDDFTASVLGIDNDNRKPITISSVCCCCCSFVCFVVDDVVVVGFLEQKSSCEKKWKEIYATIYSLIKVLSTAIGRLGMEHSNKREN